MKAIRTALLVMSFVLIVLGLVLTCYDKNNSVHHNYLNVVYAFFIVLIGIVQLIIALVLSNIIKMERYATVEKLLDR